MAFIPGMSNHSGAGGGKQGGGYGIFLVFLFALACGGGFVWLVSEVFRLFPH